MTGEPAFVDTNVLVYAYDADAGEKHTAANVRLQALWDDESGLTSTQVLQEFYVTVTRKLSRPLSRRTAREVVATYRTWPVHRPDAATSSPRASSRNAISCRSGTLSSSSRRAAQGRTFRDASTGEHPAGSG